MIIKNIKDVDKTLIHHFDCGNDLLNNYLFKYAAQNDSRNISKTFVLTDNNSIYGYYTLSSASINFDDVDEKFKRNLPKYPIPSVRIARLAVDKNYIRKGIGSQLLKDAFLRIVEISKQTGVYFVIVDSKEQAKSFYEHYGFMKLSSFESTYIFPINTIIKAISNHIKD